GATERARLKCACSDCRSSGESANLKHWTQPGCVHPAVESNPRCAESILREESRQGMARGKLASRLGYTSRPLSSQPRVCIYRRFLVGPLPMGLLSILGLRVSLWLRLRFALRPLQWRLPVRLLPER